MALREKFGRLVLLDETEVSGLGREYRAARLGPTGLDRLVTVLCFSPPVSTHTVATKRLMDEARLAARLQNPGLVRVLGIGRVEQTFYISTELVEGRTLATILGRCSHDSFPFAADHALMVASRAAAALEYLHGKKDDAGRPLFHGLLSPSRLVVAFDGEVKIKGLGLWSALRGTNLLVEADRRWLAPEQAGDGTGEPRSDVYALGMVLLEALTGTTPGDNPLAVLPSARIVSVTGEASPLPKTLSDLLSRALAPEPAQRFASITEMRKAIDTLLFSGDFTPTTFDLAFFMHTLFRDEMERETKAVEDARRADYREFLEEKSAPAMAAPAAAEAPAAPEPATLPMAPAVPEPTIVAAPMAPPATVAMPPVAPPATVIMAPVAPPADEVAKLPATAPVLHPDPARSGSGRSTIPLEPPHAPAPFHSGAHAAHVSAPAESGAHSQLGEEKLHAPDLHRETRSARDAGRDITPKLGIESAQDEPPSRKGLWIALGLVVLLAVGGGGGWWLLSRGAAPTSTTTTMSAEVIAAMTRVRELEERIQQIEQERADAENKAAEEARQRLEAQAAARGRAVDPAALAKAQEEARQKARADQERRQQEELTRLAEARRAEERRIAEASPAPTTAPATVVPTTLAPAPTPVAVATALPTTEPATTTTTTAPATTAAPEPAQEVAKIVPPALVSQVAAVYPPIARMRRIAGTVELTATVDETGKVVDVRVVRATPARMGFEEAALQAARQRKYKPATRNGVPIRMAVPIVMNFR